MRVDFQGYGRVRVTHKILDLLDIHTGLEAAGGVCVPQDMRRDVVVRLGPVDAGCLLGLRSVPIGHQLPELLEGPGAERSSLGVVKHEQGF